MRRYPPLVVVQERSGCEPGPHGCLRNRSRAVCQATMMWPSLRTPASMRLAGLVSARHDAQRRLYELRPEPLAEIDAWLQPYRQLWAGRLDELERHLERNLDRPPGGQTKGRSRP